MKIKISKTRKWKLESVGWKQKMTNDKIDIIDIGQGESEPKDI